MSIDHKKFYYKSLIGKKVKITKRYGKYGNVPPERIVGLIGHLHDYDELYFYIFISDDELNKFYGNTRIFDGKNIIVQEMSAAATEITLFEEEININNEDDLCPNCKIMCKWIMMQLKCPNCRKVIAG